MEIIFRPNEALRRRYFRQGSWVARLLAVVILFGLVVPTSTAAESPYQLALPHLAPTRATPGESMRLSITLQARGAPGLAVLSLVVLVNGLEGVPVQVAALRDQRFGAWQARRYEIDWPVPADLSTNELQLTVRVLDDTDAERTRWQAVVPVERSDTELGLPGSSQQSAAEPGRPPRHCQSEFQILGGDRFASSVRDNLAFVYRVAPDYYDMIMSCDSASGATRIERIIQVGPPYSDRRGSYSDGGGSIWLRDHTGAVAASLLVHEAAHINRTGWNVRGSLDCSPENEALEWQARFLDRVAEVDTDQKDQLGWLAGWYREQKNVHNCPAR